MGCAWRIRINGFYSVESFESTQVSCALLFLYKSSAYLYYLLINIIYYCWFFLSLWTLVGDWWVFVCYFFFTLRLFIGVIETDIFAWIKSTPVHCGYTKMTSIQLRTKILHKLYKIGTQTHYTTYTHVIHNLNGCASDIIHNNEFHRFDFLMWLLFFLHWHWLLTILNLDSNWSFFSFYHNISKEVLL